MLVSVFGAIIILGACLGGLDVSTKLVSDVARNFNVGDVKVEPDLGEESAEITQGLSDMEHHRNM